MPADLISGEFRPCNTRSCQRS